MNLEALTAAFGKDNFNVDGHVIYNGRLGVRAVHKTAKNMVNNQFKKAYYVEGNHYEMGYLIGLLAEAEVEQMTGKFADNMVPAFVDNDNTPRNSEIIKGIGEFILKVVNEMSHDMNCFVPKELEDEMRGIVDGCRQAKPGMPDTINAERLRMINFGQDILTSIVYTGKFPGPKINELQLHPSELRIPMMCNGFSLFGDAAGGNHFFGRDFMFPTAEVYQDTACMIIYNPIGVVSSMGNYKALPMVSLSAPGFVGSPTVMNIHGVGIGVQIVPSGNCTPDNIGMNSLLLVRYAGQYAISAKSAEKIMVDSPRGVSWLYIIGDGENDQACVVEAGSSSPSVKSDFLSYVDPSIKSNGLVPDPEFMQSNITSEWKNGIRTRWNDYQYRYQYLQYNIRLLSYYNETYYTYKKFWDSAFNENGYIDVKCSDRNCPGSFYFPPQRETRNDFVMATNHYIIPEMRLSTMTRWLELLLMSKLNPFDNSSKNDDIQWRYDKLNYIILSELKMGPIDYNKAKCLIDFLSPKGNNYGPECASNSTKSPGGETRIEGSTALCDLKKKTIEGHYGYFCDEWVKITLPDYLDDPDQAGNA